MTDQNQVPRPFAVRKVGTGNWEVLIATEDTWVSCQSEEDARIIATAPVREYESLERTRRGAAFADELERLGNTLEKYNIGFGSRFFAARAAELRKEMRE